MSEILHDISVIGGNGNIPVYIPEENTYIADICHGIFILRKYMECNPEPIINVSREDLVLLTRDYPELGLTVANTQKDFNIAVLSLANMGNIQTFKSMLEATEAIGSGVFKWAEDNIEGVPSPNGTTIGFIK